MINPTKTKTVFEEREQLKRHLAAAEEELFHLRIENSKMLAARKVANAAVVYLAAVDSFGKTRSAKEYFDGYNPANAELRAAIAEYRALPLSPEKTAEMDKALAQLEDEGALEEMAMKGEF